MKRKITQMSALCIAQPWATCIFMNGKNIENNSRNINLRGTIAIYASQSYKKDRFAACKDIYDVVHEFDQLPKGVILGFVDVVDVIIPGQKNVPSKYTKWWQDSSFGLVLENVIMLERPVGVDLPNGAVKFWHLKDEQLEKVLVQISDEQIEKFKEWEIPKNRILSPDAVKAKEKNELKDKSLAPENWFFFTGTKPLTLKQIAGKLLNYAEENELIESEGEEEDLSYFILSDAKLKKIFNKDKIYAFEMADFLSMKIKESK